MALSEFLLDSKEQYLSAVREGKGQDWTVVMGNEAGDLDSIASSIAYSWFATTVKKSPAVALIQTRHEDIALRPENIHAFSLASLSPDQRELLCIDDIPQSNPFPSNKFALVDHNHLLSRFSEGNEDAKVVAVLDHHDDEGLYKDTADPRMIIVPTGSATSIVTQHIQFSNPSAEIEIPAELAALLFCGILVDTDGLKPNGKAELLDHESAAFLLPRSSFASSDQFGAHSAATLELHSSSPVQFLTQELLEKKSSVAQLSTTDLLRRDYKQYEWLASWMPDEHAVRVGLATVPVDLKTWIPRDISEFWSSVDNYMDACGLDILGILTSFHGKPKKNKKGKHKRQVLFIVRHADGGELEERLWAGLESSAVLELERHSMHKYAKGAAADSGVGERSARAYKQGNVKASRKAIAPLLKETIEGAFKKDEAGSDAK
ncbi:DHH phosphoesterase [Phellopilus nigrolimitatus]|nr:DHH phosphoesterase [Phellopilus nigrolimitatus]